MAMNIETVADVKHLAKWVGVGVVPSQENVCAADAVMAEIEGDGRFANIDVKAIRRCLKYSASGVLVSEANARGMVCDLDRIIEAQGLADAVRERGQRGG